MKMTRRNPAGDYPKIDKTSYVDPAATIIGNVKIGKNVYVGPGAVLRADEINSSITIGGGCNVQDRAIVHCLANTSAEIGAHTSLSHGCIVHGPCRIGNNCFIGFGSVVFRAKLADAVIVKHSAVVEGVEISAGKVVPNNSNIDAKQKTKRLKPAPKHLTAFCRKVVNTNLALAKGYRA